MYTPCNVHPLQCIPLQCFFWVTKGKVSENKGKNLKQINWIGRTSQKQLSFSNPFPLPLSLTLFLSLCVSVSLCLSFSVCPSPLSLLSPLSQTLSQERIMDPTSNQTRREQKSTCLFSLSFYSTTTINTATTTTSDRYMCCTLEALDRYMCCPAAANCHLTLSQK